MKKNILIGGERGKQWETPGQAMKCKRCGQDIEADAPASVVICGSCADDLRAEQDAIEGAAIGEAEK